MSNTHIEEAREIIKIAVAKKGFSLKFESEPDGKWKTNFVIQDLDEAVAAALARRDAQHEAEINELRITVNARLKFGAQSRKILAAFDALRSAQLEKRGEGKE